MSDTNERLARIETHLEHYNELLKEHIRRTDIAEKRIDELYKYKWMALGIISFAVFAAQLLAKRL